MPRPLRPTERTILTMDDQAAAALYGNSFTTREVPSQAFPEDGILIEEWGSTPVGTEESSWGAIKSLYQ